MRANKTSGTLAAAVVAMMLSTAPLVAQQPPMHDLTAQLANAGVVIDGLRAVEVGGIVVLRGKAAGQSAAEQAALVAQSLGYPRVANLIQVAEVPDDAGIARAAERELSMYRGLDGTQIAVDSNNGVVRLTGRVSSELQKDMAVSLVRNIRGVRSVRIALQR